jgi:hypothetical protein
MKDRIPEIRWRDSAQDHDFDVAHEYLALRLTPARAAALVPKLRDAPLVTRRVNDVLRACDRPALPFDDRGVKWKLDTVVSGKKLTPALLVSFDGVGADVCQGFHELSLTYGLDPFMEVPVIIAYET